MVGRTNTGGGGSGATLTIMGVAGATVTASKNGKTYTRTINNSGTAVFKGLSTGTWTVTMSGNGQTATRTVEITADYSLTIAYFSATIAITYPANSTCVIKNSSGVQVASDTNTGSSTKTWTATVNATGTYTVIATATDGSEKSKSQSVEITSDGQSVNVELSYALVIFEAGKGLNQNFSCNTNLGSTPTISIDKISVPYGTGNYVFLPSIDTTPYSTLEVITQNCNYGKDGGSRIGVGAATTGETFAASGDIINGTINIDISAVNQENLYIKYWTYLCGYEILSIKFV